MPRSPLTFKQRDVQRAIKAAFKAGAKEARVEINGKVVVVACGPQESPVAPVAPVNDGVNEWDRI